MAGDGSDRANAKVRLEHMPPAVKKLVDTMLGINPNFEIEDWLVQKAEEDLSLINLDLEREKTQLRQRIHRLESLAERLNSKIPKGLEDGQTNLFDSFDISPPIKHLVDRISSDYQEDPHPAGTITDLLLDDSCDDPLLALTAQMMLMAAQNKIGDGANWVDIEDLFKPLLSNGISKNECIEALDYLLMSGQIHEIDDDCFIPEM